MTQNLRTAWIFALLTPAIFAQGFDKAAVERGRAEFKASCGFCHADDATGNRGPDLVRSDLVSHDSEGDLLTRVIRNGRPDQGMPAFPSLAERQIADIAVFLHVRAEEALHSNQVPRDYPLSKLLTGNAQSGKAFFNGAGGCSKCHSISGDLARIGSKYAPLELQQRMLYPPRSKRPHAIVKTADGKTIEGALNHIDEFEISITDETGWHRSFARDRVTVEVQDPLAAHRELMPKYTDADIHNVFAYLVAQK